MIVSAIAAMGKNRVIGKDNQLLWKLPLELKYFKETTMGHHLILGRKTFESRPPLPNRTSIIVTRNKKYNPPAGCFVVHSIESAIELAHKRGEEEVFISGGEEIYHLSMPHIQKLYLTEVDFSAEGDAYFPVLVPNQWNLESENFMPVSEKNPLAWTARIYVRK
nr:Dihydrofolate reductase [uncultured bacterium]